MKIMWLTHLIPITPELREAAKNAGAMIAVCADGFELFETGPGEFEAIRWDGNIPGTSVAYEPATTPSAWAMKKMKPDPPKPYGKKARRHRGYP